MFGLGLLIGEDLFDQPAWAGFRSVFPNEAWLGWTMLALGFARIGGLVVNGAQGRHADHPPGLGWAGLHDLVRHRLRVRIVWRHKHFARHLPLFGIGDRPLALMSFGGVLPLTAGVRFLGLWQGQKALPKASTGDAEVAAVIVDPTELNKLAREVWGWQSPRTSNRWPSSFTHHKCVLWPKISELRQEMYINREVNRRG